MASRLERKWWFAAPVAVAAVLLTQYVMNAAGIAHPYRVSQWVLYFLCFAGLQRGFSFAGWLLVLCLAPSNEVRERTR